MKKIATFLYHYIFRPLLANSAARVRVERHMASLCPGKNKEQLVAEYYIEKIRTSLMLFLAASVLAFLVSLNIAMKSTLDGSLVPKNTWKEGSYALDLVIEAPDYSDSVRDLRIVVEPVSLSVGEVSVLASEAFRQLETAILGTNESLSAVVAPLNLIERLPDFPFAITWESDQPLLVRADGRINNSEITAGEIVKLTAFLIYQDQQGEYSFNEDYYVYLLPAPIADTDEWAEVIMAAVAASQQEDALTDFFHLPGEVGGVTVAWQEKKASDGLYLWLMAVFAAVLAFVGKDQELQKKVAQRNKQIDRDYPELVRKLALYLGAGMTMRGAWKRVAYDYTQRPAAANKTKYIYEEMLYSVREMENGVPEREVYEHFGKRVGIAKYRKLTGLFCNHLQKGNNNLLQVLRDEVELALDDRKKAARAIGEEMSTKLLLPMMMMLMIVMIIIMVPAFQMF